MRKETLPKGYKRTEVGVIPEDWNAIELPKVFWYQEGPGLRKWQFRSEGLKVVNITNLQENGYLDLSRTDRHITWQECERIYKHFLIDSGDFLMASSGNSYCKTSIVRSSDLPLLMNTSVIRFKPLERTDSKFMQVFLKSKYFKEQIDLMITGGAQPNFGPAHLEKIWFHSQEKSPNNKPSPPRFLMPTPSSNRWSNSSPRSDRSSREPCRSC